MSKSEDNFLKEMLEGGLFGVCEDAMIGGLPLEKLLNAKLKTAGNIIADAKVAGKKVEAENLAEAVQFLTARIDEVTSLVKAKEEERNEEINRLEKALDDAEGRSAKLGRNLSQVEDELEKANLKNIIYVATISDAKNILAMSSGEATDTEIIGKLRNIFSPTTTAPLSNGANSIKADPSGISQPG